MCELAHLVATLGGVKCFSLQQCILAIRSKVWRAIAAVRPENREKVFFHVIVMHSFVPSVDISHAICKSMTHPKKNTQRKHGRAAQLMNAKIVVYAGHSISRSRTQKSE